MASINFTGLASGLDTRAIIDAILEFEREPIERLETRRTLFSSRRSALEELRSKIGSFETALRDLSSFSTFRGRVANVSDDSVLRATASAGAEAGVFDINVTQLAEAHKIHSFGFDAVDEDLVDDGTITIKSGDNDEITIDVSAANSNKSLNAVRDAINDADAGVQASIIFDGTQNVLTVRAEESGLDNALVVTDSTNLGLTDAGALVTAGLNAELTIDGIDITSSTNRVTGAISGVTLDLVGLSEGTEVTNLEVAQDFDSIVEATEELVSQYNDLLDFFNEQNASGPLAGDTTARSAQAKIQSLFTGGLPGIAVGGIRSLSSLGVSFDGKTGNASLDATVIRDLLDTNFDEIGDLFLSTNRATDPRIQLSGVGSVADGQYAVEVSSVAEQASLTGSGSFTTLRRPEALTIELNGVSSRVVLDSGLDPDEVVDAINAQVALDGVAVTASQEGGVLTIASDAFGADQELYIESSRNGGSRQTGFTRDGGTDFGADLVGRIGGFDATTEGQLLVGAEGTEVEGLSVRVNATTADGDFGFVNISRGLIGTMEQQLKAFTRFGDGSLDLARDSLDAGIEQFNDDIERIEDRLVVRETQLLRQFTEAERAISLLNSQQASFGATGI